jgi:hypothetical protein
MLATATSIIGTGTTPTEGRSGSAARLMVPAERKELGVRVLARSEPVARLAAARGVSRKFAYAVAGKADAALAAAFEPPRDDGALFLLPVTTSRIEAMVVGLALLCHASYRGIVEFLRDVIGKKIGVTTVHDILVRVAVRAAAINGSIPLSAVRDGLHDEIYQGGSPVLVGIDAKSIYAYLLSQEESCDETTWGVHLLELEEKLGLHPDRTTADGGKGLRAGQAAAWPDVPCGGDVFHAELDFGKVASFLANRAKGAVSARSKLERQMERAKKKGRGNQVSKRLAVARATEASAVALARDVRTLADWMRDDVLAIAGGALPERRELYDFIVGELARLEPECPHRIRPLRTMLESGRDTLLAFAAVLDERLAEVARTSGVMPHVVRGVCELQGLDAAKPLRHERESALRQELRGRFHDIERAVAEAMTSVVRASSLVENVNSRLRGYFFLRRELGPVYLELLRFFLNHHPFARSDRPERVGKSPRELLTGQPHAHWLELLGYELAPLN